MAYERITWLPDVLKTAGVAYELVPGWKDRGLGDYRRWEPAAVVWHHDASPKGDSPGVVKFILDHFQTNGASVWIDRAGVWHIIASGRTAHTGNVRPGMPDNETAIGIETDHTTGEDWPPALLDSLRLGTAAIFNARGWPADALHFHKSICDPPGRKVDPDGLELADERRTVARLMARMADQSDRGDRGPVVSLKRLQRLARRATWSRGYGAQGRAQVAVVRAALKAEGHGNYRKWQQALGYTGKDADGIPGEASLTELGKRHGFVVTE